MIQGLICKLDLEIQSHSNVNSETCGPWLLHFYSKMVQQKREKDSWDISSSPEVTSQQNLTILVAFFNYCHSLLEIYFKLYRNYKFYKLPSLPPK